MAPLTAGGQINSYLVYTWCPWISFHVKNVNPTGTERRHNKAVSFLIRISIAAEKKNRDLDTCVHIVSPLQFLGIAVM